MQAVIVSSCLLGRPVRYDGGGTACGHPIVARWLIEGRVVAVCPEVAGGLPTPRPPAEIEAAKGGHAVLLRGARVVDATGHDVTPAFVRGAQHALAVARSAGARIAVLKEGSPSCGSGYTYDGSFSGGRAPLAGVTAAALRNGGIRVFSEAQLEEAAAYLERLEAESGA